ncbi:hypothetical protein DSO57_1007123 [Entomophthora muscae]|uniref:Uncharacterized protein n=1 Tax=Entomophthora muscae TaxID=34485 RepID=A0ACC2SK47_9FUNG|nr:hypothetical protein DSO57_1007123 [Entomophthora muscae]
MILLVVKFVVFSLGPFFLLLWSTSPNLWSRISSSAQLLSEDPPSLLSLPRNLFHSGEAVVKSLTYDDLDLGDAAYASLTPVGEEVSMPSFPDLQKSSLEPLCAPVMPPPAPTCTPWLLKGMALMALNAYLPQMSSVSSLWYPLQAAVPVLHWAASWWFVLPRWEPNLVSLAPLSHRKCMKNPQPCSPSTSCCPRDCPIWRMTSLPSWHLASTRTCIGVQGAETPQAVYPDHVPGLAIMAWVAPRRTFG